MSARELRDERGARSLSGRGCRAKSSFMDRLRQDDRETLAREQAECEACQAVERVAIYGGFAHCDRHRRGASGPIAGAGPAVFYGGAGRQPSLTPEGPLVDDGASPSSHRARRPHTSTAYHSLARWGSKGSLFRDS